MKYSLFNKNRKILDFIYDEEVQTIIKIDHIYDEKYAPIGIINYKQGITRSLFNNWWNHRSIPASRQDIDLIKENYHLDGFEELIIKSFGASLSDQYWVYPADKNVSWDDINFFHNDFSEELGEVLFGFKTLDSLVNACSPDFTSDGNLKKRWKIINGDRYLIKGGSNIFNQEPFNEVIATKLYERILNPNEYVSYSLIEEHGNYYSICRDFIDEDEELVPAIYIDMVMNSKLNDSLFNRYLSCCSLLDIPNAKHFLNKMIVCDYIIGNYDRHYRNFGAIRNVETLKWIGPAPIFDSGSSLWANCPNTLVGSSYTAKPFIKDINKQLNLVDDYSWIDFKKLEGFTDDIRSILKLNVNIDDIRINKICEAVDNRISNLFEIAKEKGFIVDENMEMNEELFDEISL